MTGAEVARALVLGTVRGNLEDVRLRKAAARLDTPKKVADFYNALGPGLERTVVVRAIRPYLGGMLPAEWP